METFAGNLSDNDMADIAAYFACQGERKRDTDRLHAATLTRRRAWCRTADPLKAKRGRTPEGPTRFEFSGRSGRI